MVRTATKAAIRKELKSRRLIGQQMSNLCFNLAQDSRIEERHRTAMDEMRRQWDAIPKEQIETAKG